MGTRGSDDLFLGEEIHAPGPAAARRQVGRAKMWAEDSILIFVFFGGGGTFFW